MAFFTSPNVKGGFAQGARSIISLFPGNFILPPPPIVTTDLQQTAKHTEQEKNSSHSENLRYYADVAFTKI